MNIKKNKDGSVIFPVRMDKIGHDSNDDNHDFGKKYDIPNIEEKITNIQTHKDGAVTADITLNKADIKEIEKMQGQKIKGVSISGNFVKKTSIEEIEMMEVDFLKSHDTSCVSNYNPNNAHITHQITDKSKVDKVIKISNIEKDMTIAIEGLEDPLKVKEVQSLPDNEYIIEGTIHKQLKIYIVSQDENSGYDTYDSFVVCAYDEDEAREYLPNNKVSMLEELNLNSIAYKMYTMGTQNLIKKWTDRIDKIKVQQVGIATDGMKQGEIICSSYNAG